MGCSDVPDGTLGGGTGGEGAHRSKLRACGEAKDDGIVFKMDRTESKRKATIDQSCLDPNGTPPQPVVIANGSTAIQTRRSRRFIAAHISRRRRRPKPTTLKTLPHTAIHCFSIGSESTRNAGPTSRSRRHHRNQSHGPTTARCFFAREQLCGSVGAIPVGDWTTC